MPSSAAIDILVNDAGIFSQSNFAELDVERVGPGDLRQPARGLPVHPVRPARMLERKSGKIINIASQLGQIGGIEMVHYSASKAGVIGLTKALAREVSAQGVHVNAIAPGPILTDMMAEETEEWAARKLAELPMARFGEPHEVAPTAVFLASDGLVVLRRPDALPQRRGRDALTSGAGARGRNEEPD